MTRPSPSEVRTLLETISQEIRRLNEELARVASGDSQMYPPPPNPTWSDAERMIVDLDAILADLPEKCQTDALSQRYQTVRRQLLRLRSTTREQEVEGLTTNA